MQSFHGDAELKRVILEGIEEHRQLDLLAAGSYRTNAGKVCAIGCQVGTLREHDPERYGRLCWNDHAGLAQALGLPEWLLRLEDRLFERLPLEARLEWPGRLIGAIPVGVDLEPVRYRWRASLLQRRIDAGADPGGVVSRVRDLCLRAGSGDMPSASEWRDARAEALAALAAAEAWAAAAAEEEAEAEAAAAEALAAAAAAEAWAAAAAEAWAAAAAAEAAAAEEAEAEAAEAEAWAAAAAEEEAEAEAWAAAAAEDLIRLCAEMGTK